MLDAKPTETDQAADPITTEVIRHGLDAAADQMRVALCRTAFSPVIYEMTDFAAALYDRDVRLLAQAQALPSFLGTLSYCVEGAVREVGGPEALDAGDVLLTTYPHHTGSHAQDIAVVVPGFVDGELIGYAAIKAHHMDLGAKAPYCTDTTDLFQEGTIFPGVKLHRAGVLDDGIYRTLLANSRLPRALSGDLRGQIGAAQLGLEALYRLVERYGREDFLRSVERIFDHGETLVRRFLESVPDGRYVAEGALDSDGINDELVPFSVAVEIDGSECTIDFTDAPAELPGPMNSPLPQTASICRLAMMTFAGGGESANEGRFRPIHVKTTPGSMFHPRPPAPSYMNGWPARAALDVIYRALAQAMPEAIPARSGGDLCAVIWWGRMEDGSFWSDATDHFMGQGASPATDGGAPLMHMTGSGIRNTPIEVLEARRPILTERFQYRAASGGRGRFRGGLGVDIHYRALRDLYVTLPWEQTRTPGWGLAGGEAGAPNALRLRLPDGEVRPLKKTTSMPIPAGAVLELQTGGGGGWGDPSQRSPEAEAEDRAEGYVGVA